MSSGDILFILVFIVLPTAVLVSAAWALVFVRQSPDRVARRQETRQAELSPYPETPGDEDDTIIFATGSSGEESIPEHIEEDLLPVAPEPTPEPEPEPVRPQYESQIPQTTEDLSSLEQLLGEPDPEPEPEPEPVEEVPEQVSSDTSDLPALEPPSSEERDEVVEEDILVDDRPGIGQVDRRRKQSARLVSGEADAPRGRGRNRDPLRQVPQLSRTNRRRDDTPPPDQG